MNTKRITSIVSILCLFVSSMLATTFEYKDIKYEVVSSDNQTAAVAAGNSISGDITIPKLVMDASTSTAYRVISISDNAFKDCTELTSVTFKAELTSIGASAFANTGLTSITIPEGVTVINESTFSGCASLSSVTLSSATTSIGKSAFANSGLTTITIPEGVTVINESTFSGCASLASVTLPSSLSYIGANAFYQSGIASLDLGFSVRTIGNSAFEGCSNLKSVNCTYRRLTLGDNAFKDCTMLENLNLEYDDTHEYVDLGLPSGTLWATCNVGASFPDEYGLYFAWGETTGHTSEYYYDWSNYQWCNGSWFALTKYCTNDGCGTVDGKTELESVDDAATTNWGSEWQMPSLAQIKELFNSNYTTAYWTTQNGVYGMLLMSKVSGHTDKSVFLPAAGDCLGTHLFDLGVQGRYWSRTLNSGDSRYAYELYLKSSEIGLTYYQRDYGKSVRPVRVQK